jgi:hypothetical protein
MQQDRIRVDMAQMSRQEIRQRVDARLRELGHDKPGKISNVDAARALGLIPVGLRGPCISGSQLLREWVEPVGWMNYFQKKLRDQLIDQGNVCRGNVSDTFVSDAMAGYVGTTNKVSKKHKAKSIKKYSEARAPSAAVSLPINSVASVEFLQTYEWRRVRMEALKKHGSRCQCCGATPATGAVMNVDHIKPRKLFPHLALSVDNLQVLCHECNHGKGNWDMTDWRPEAKENAR